jgi:hypothetical protein
MRVDDLERELRAARPEVDPQFASKLDEWAAAGFPRGGMLEQRARSRASGWIRRAEARIRGPRPPARRILLPVGAAATLVIVVGVALTQGGSLDGDDSGAVELSAGEPGDVREDAASAEKAVPNASTAELDSGRTSALEPLTQGGGLARGREERIEDRTARLSLGAGADEVQEVANGVIEVTDRHEGFVLNSQVTSDQGGARASFELEIPAAKLDQALSDLSGLADVISRTEASEDITAQAVRAHRNLANTLDQIRKLQIDLIEADTFEDRRIIRAQIAALKARADVFEAEENRALRQARFATVAVTVTSDGPAADDGWGLDDALDDAGDVLTALGGVALITLAIVVPVALVGVIAYWLVMSARRRGRDKSLDG